MRSIRLACAVLALAVVAGACTTSPEGNSAQPRSDTVEQPGIAPESSENESGEQESQEAESESAEINGRTNWFLEQRMGPDNTIPPGGLARAQRQAVRIAAGGGGAPAAPTAGLDWSSFGPTPIKGADTKYNGRSPWGGRVTDIAHDPTNAAVAYLGSANGGVWKTTNSGGNWTAVFDSSCYSGTTRITCPSAIGAIAVNPSNANVVYVGTGEANLSTSSYFGRGIFRSPDGGATWYRVGGTRFDGCYISSIVVQGVTVFAAVGKNGRYSWSSCENGIHESTNSGGKWTLARSASQPATDLVQKPGSPLVLYAAFYTRGVWKTTDGGTNWSQVTTGLPTSGFNRIALATTPAKASTVYAAFGSANQATYGTYRSNDSGASWNALPYSNYCGYTDGYSAGGQCSYDLSIAAYPTNANYLYAGGIRVQRFDGSSWTTLGYGATGIHVDIHSVSFDVQNRLWIGSDGGAYRKDGTSSFINLNNTLGLAQFYPGISGKTSTILLGGTQDNGTLQYTPGGGWYEFDTGDGGYSAWNPTSSRRFASYVSATVNRYESNGTKTCVITANSDPNIYNYCTIHLSERVPFIAPLVQSPSSNSTLYLGTSRILKTTNDGTNWTGFSPQYAGTVSAIGPAASNSSVVYAAWTGNNATAPFAAYTADGGTTWSGTAALPWRQITDIAVKKNAPGTVWVTVSGYNSQTSTTPGHVFVSQDYGVTWDNVSGNLPDAPVNGIEVDSRYSPSRLYVATDVGVFWSVDGGASWANTSTGMPPTVVMDIKLDTAGSKLISVTHGRGAFVATPPA